MSTAIRPACVLRTILQRAIIKDAKRFYAPRSSNIGLDDENLSMDQLPTRLKKRLSKRGLTLDDLQISPKIPPSADLESSSKPNAIATQSVSLPEPVAALAKDEDLSHLLKDMVSGAPPLDSTTTASVDLFPSDTQKNTDLNKKRDQSRKAYRPRMDPSQTSLILFPGQGSQFVGMGRDTLGYGKASDLFEEASAVLKYDLLKLCLEGPLSTLSKTVHCQPAILVSSLAAAEKLGEQYPEATDNCVGTAGFSVGEYAALVYAGVIEFADAVELVRVRAEVMQRASEETPSGMMSVFLNHNSRLKTAMTAAKEYCRQRCHIADPVCTVANYLYPECKVIAGHAQALDFVEKHAKTFGLRRVKRLPVSGAFHTSLMSSARPPLRDILRKTQLSAPSGFPVYSNVSASITNKPERMVELLEKQMVSPVKWEQIMHVLYSRPQGENFPTSFEVGPGKHLGMMLKSVNLKAYEKYIHVDV